MHQITHSREYKTRCLQLGLKVRRLRDAKQMTLADVADACGVVMRCAPPSLKTIHEIEAGRGPSIGVYMALCETLNKGRGLL